MDESFWNNGLKFECQRCSSCCRYEPGVVFLSKYDIKRLLQHFKISFKEFVLKYIKTVDIGTGYYLSLTEKDNNDCILWNNGCSCYEARPIQCSTYPFWSSILSSKRNWDDEKESCPGIDKGSIICTSEIEQRLWLRRAYPPFVLEYGQSLESIDENSFLGSEGIITDTSNTSTN